jgi:hypothetical protein
VLTAAELDLRGNKYPEALARAVAAQAMGLKLETWEGLRALGPGMRSLRALHLAVEAEGECVCGGAGVPPCCCRPCIVMRLILEPSQRVRGRGERGDLSTLWLMERWLCLVNRGSCAAADTTLPVGGAQARRTASTASSRSTPTRRC